MYTLFVLLQVQIQPHINIIFILYTYYNQYCCCYWCCCWYEYHIVWFISFPSTEDSEPIYDDPHLLPCHSDSEAEDHRASSTSPPPGGQHNHYAHEDGITEQYSCVVGEMYNECRQPDTEHLLKPSQLKSKSAMYTGGWFSVIITSFVCIGILMC